MTTDEYRRKFKVNSFSSDELRAMYRRSLFWTADRTREPTEEEKERFRVWIQKHWDKPGFREKFGKIQKKSWKDRARRKRLSIKTKRLWADPKFRANISKKLAKYYSNPEARKQKSRQFLKLWKDPAFLKKMAKRPPSPGAVSRLTEEQWREAISWLSDDPRRHGIDSVRWYLTHIRFLIKKKWGQDFVEKTIEYHLKKRGCRVVKIAKEDPVDLSSLSLRYRKWIGPAAGRAEAAKTALK